MFDRNRNYNKCLGHETENDLKYVSSLKCAFFPFILNLEHAFYVQQQDYTTHVIKYRSSSPGK